MPDFSWVNQHKQILSRSAVQSAFEQHGYAFQPAPKSLAKEQRPRAIGTTADKRARLELIGPEDIVFKGTLIRTISAGMTDEAAQLQSDIADFLGILVSGWPDAQSWSAAFVAGLPEQPSCHYRLSEMQIDAHVTPDQRRVVVGVTWEP